MNYSDFVRNAAFSGSFYPSTKAEILKTIGNFENRFIEEFGDLNLNDYSAKGIIVPHAGWVYSGFTAYTAYKVLSNMKIEKIAVLGPSHRHYFDGVVADKNNFWLSPLGKTEIIKDDFFDENDVIHSDEHSLEVQLPFLQYFFPNIKILPLVCGNLNADIINKTAKHLFDYNYTVLISTDLSHYFPYDEAKDIDAVTINQILKMEDRHIEACGINPLRIGFSFMSLAKIQPHLIHYETSAKAFGDTSSVVGYASFWF